MLVHSFDEGTDVLRLHVGVHAVAEVSDVALCAKTLQHRLHDVGNALLKGTKGGSDQELCAHFKLGTTA